MRARSFIAVLLLSGLALGTGLARQDDTPEGCVKAFIDALNAKDLKAAFALVVTAKGAAPENLNGLGQQLNRGYTVKSTKLYGDGDDVVVSAEIALSSAPTRTLHDMFRLIKTDGHWKILPLDLAHMTTPPPSIVAALMASDMGGPRQAAEKTACLSNVKQLALGNIIYANDYDDKMPPSDHWKADIMPYVKKVEIFHCPEDKRAGAISYRMSDLLSRVSSTAIAEPAGTIMIYEGESGEFNPRHAGRGSVGYADGHAKQVLPAEFTKGYRKP
jgi:prepilin-type processing-associated H-X9-DG protein